MKNTLFIIAFSLSVTFGYSELSAQEIGKLIPQHTIDSLQTLIKNHPQDDQQKVILLNQYARNSFYNYEVINGFNAALEARDISRTIDFKGGVILYHITIDKFFGWFERHTFHENKAKKLSQEKGQSQYFSKNKYLIGYHYWEGNNEKRNKILKIYEEAFSYFTNKGNKEVQIEILFIISTLTLWSNDEKKSAEYFSHLSQLCEEFGQTYWSIIAKLGEVKSLQQLGDYEGMKNSFEGVLTKIAEISDIQQRANIFNRLGSYYSDNNEFAMAADYFNQSMEINKKLNNRDGLAYNLYSLSGLYSKLQMPIKAYESIEKTIEIIKQNGRRDAYIRAFNTSLTIKNFEKAREYLNILEKHLELQQPNHWLVLNKVLESQILLDVNDFKEAIPILEQIHALQAANNNISQIFMSSRSIAQSYFQLGENHKALTYALRSKKELIAFNRKDIDFKDLHKLLSDIYGALGQKNKAFDHLKLYNEIDDAQKLKENASKVLQFEMQSLLKNSTDKINALDQERTEQQQANKLQRLWIFSIAGALVSLLVLTLLLFRNNKNKQKAHDLLKVQKEEIQTTLVKLEATQSQLIQSEKMASLGELTAGIAHEIQNPLNFVNNFSEVSEELLEELEEEIDGNVKEEIKEIITDLKLNLNKINHHGERASSIVKGMLDHSRTSSGKKEVTDLNLLADEYLRLSYHGLRAKDKSFNANFTTNFDENLSRVPIIPQDFGRVILNLINNAFYSVNKKGKEITEDYEPTVTIATKEVGDAVVISIRDNGEGIPKDVIDKIFQPFFTTKPTGQGTGLGLSLAYDIVTKQHGGQLSVSSEKGSFTKFTIELPTLKNKKL